MKKLILLAFALPMTVFAQVTEPVDVSGIVGILPAILNAFKNGQYLLAGALVSLILTFVIKTFVLPKVKLGNGVLPIVSALIGCLAGVSIAVANGAEPLAATLAVFSGPVASTLWDSIVKYFFPKPA